MTRSDPPGSNAPRPSTVAFSPALERTFLGSELDELVELTTLHDCFTLLDAIQPGALPYAAIVEQLFSATFYSSLWTDPWSARVEQWLGKPLVYTVTHTPFRKFKAVLPWLSSTCQANVLNDCLCAELLSSLFYLYDDVLDRRTTRNGQETAFGLFGREGSDSSWKRAFKPDTPEAEPFFQGDEERRRLWNKSLDEIAEREHVRAEEQDGLCFRAYCDQSAKRTGFLGEWWQLVAARAGNEKLYDALGNIYPDCAIVGQIRNDLCNIDGREEQNGGVRFSDFTTGRITAVTILVREWIERIATSQERSWFHQEVWRKNKTLSPEDTARLAAMCRESDVGERLTNFAECSIKRIKAQIATSDLSDDLKALWAGWVFRQFHIRLTGDYQEGDASAGQFIQAIRWLSHPAQQTDGYVPSPRSDVSPDTRAALYG